MNSYPIVMLSTAIWLLASLTSADDQPDKIKVFILAGQSNMVGFGNSRELPDSLREGDPRVLMFQNGKWQKLRPFRKASKSQERLGLTEFTFGPEIGFAHALADAYPDETIGIVKHAVGGTSILTWRSDWSREDADRVGQGRLGSLYKVLIDKLERAKRGQNIEVAGFLWLQGGKDMRHASVAKEYLTHLKSLVAAVRKDTGSPDLPFFCGSPRRTQDPDDISSVKPQPVEGPYPGVEFVLKAQWDARQEIPRTRVVILRDIDSIPRNVHYNTAGQLQVGRLFAKSYLEAVSK